MAKLLICMRTTGYSLLKLISTDQTIRSYSFMFVRQTTNPGFTRTPSKVKPGPQCISTIMTPSLLT